MNRKHLLGIGLLSAATLLTGCLADTAESATDLVPISLTSVVEAQTSPAGRSATRTTATNLQSDQLPDGEPFYVHFPSGVKQLSGADLTSTTFTADGKGGTSSVTQQPFFARSATSATLCAYHGMSGGTAQVTETTNKFAVALDQSGDNAYKASDLLYATTSVEKAFPSATAALQFTHKMSKVMVSVTLGAGISSVSAVRIIGGTRAIAITNPATTNESTAAYLGAASADAADQLSDNDGKRIILYSGTYNDQNTALECAGLIPPQTITGNFLQVVTSAGTATYSLASKTFAAGENYTYNILVNPASLGITTDITDWDSGSEMNFVNNGTAKMYYSHGTALADATVGMIIGADGLVYSTVETATSAGTIAVAVVAFIGTTELNDETSTVSTKNEHKNITPSKGVAIALCNAKSQNWDNADVIEADGNFTNEIINAVSALKTAGKIQSDWMNLEHTSWVAIGLTPDSESLNSPITSGMTNPSDYTNMSGGYWSTSEGSSSNGWHVYPVGWQAALVYKTASSGIRPVFAF